MDSLNLADTFITFFALFGPQKVLLSFGRLSRTLDDHSARSPPPPLPPPRSSARSARSPPPG